MRSPALAIGWEFRRRHRWGLTAVAGYLFVVAMIRFLILEPGEPVLVDSGRFAAVVSMPLTATFVYLLAVFSFGFAGDLAARHSMYPARMFTLPVTNAALVGWPMLYGTAAVAILWLAARLVAVWPSGIEIPVIWPALLAAALLAWTQALTWMPYGLPGIRLIVAALCLAALDTVVLLAIYFKAREPVMVAILAPQLPLAYLVARFAVARARRGDVPDWRGMFARPARTAALTGRRDHFLSTARAQVWFEWRPHGRSLPAPVGLPPPLELALLWLPKEPPAFGFVTLFLAPFTPTVVLLILAGFIVATWKQLVQSLHIGLTGREWIVKGSVLLTLTFLILLGQIIEWIVDSPGVQRALWNALPLILAGLVGLKMSAAAWIATRLDRSRLLGDRALVAGAACWVFAVLALYGVLVWFFSTPFVARYQLALIAIPAVPLARISAAPLALDWNRHR